MREKQTYTSPEITVAELDTKDIMSLSAIDNSSEDGTYKGENSAFWEG